MRAVDAPTVAVVGGGAIGGFLTRAVHDAGREVTLCLRRPIESLTVETGGRRSRVPARLATSPAGLRPVDWVLLATKALDVGGTVGWLDALVDADTTVVVAQNGVDHTERVGPLIGPARLLPALVYVAAERTGPGLVVHRAGNRLVVPAGDAGTGFRDLMAGSGLRVELSPDFRTEAWRKLFTNLAANPITALTLRRMDVLADADVARLARDLLTEGVAVAAAEGARVGPDEVDRAMYFYRGFAAADGTSMLHDRLAGRPLEHELIVGAVVRSAERHHVAVPLNRMMLTLLRALRATPPPVPDAPAPAAARPPAPRRPSTTRR